MRVVLRYFGDEGHPQPDQPSRAGPAINGNPAIECPRWGRLPTRDGDEAPAAPAQQPNLPRLPPLPPDVNLFQFASIQKAVRMFRDGESLNTVANNTIFNPHDAARVRWLWQLDYLKLNDSDVLVIDWHVARSGKKYALRVWDERPERWVDPNKT